jgi:glucuronate isomerase
MMSFITHNFLLQTETAQRLYWGFAAHQPILDFHCHLSPAAIAGDRRFDNLHDIWIEGDHYKWRAMRANGIAERFCTGDATPYEKFLAWARTVPRTLRNPLYHWTHLELNRYFSIAELLDERSGPAIWKRANALLAEDGLSVKGILNRFDVRAVCTTDDPTDDLQHHAQIAGAGLATRVFPTFRPDRALHSSDPAAYNSWIDRLAKVADVEIVSLADLREALRRRHDDFHRHGCRMSDHGLERCFADFPPEQEASAIFTKVRSGKNLAAQESERLAASLMLFFAQLDAEKGWTKQLHLGAARNVNSRMLRELGRDTGFDSIGDGRQMQALGAFLDRLDSENCLPRMVLYNLNPADNYTFAAMAGNFQDGSGAAKIQFGSAWWFLDHKDGIEAQLNALSNTGLLASCIGMLTDSRSFMSFPRHEYFRRVLCNLLGGEMEAGLLPSDEKLVGGMVASICFRNALEFLRLDVSAEKQSAGSGPPPFQAGHAGVPR